MSDRPAVRVGAFSSRAESHSARQESSISSFLLFFVFAILAIVPCLFPGRESFGDLPSHLYNSWLATLIKNHQAPGLALAHQSTNVLVDLRMEPPTSFALLAFLLFALSLGFVLRSARNSERNLGLDPLFHIYVISVLAVFLIPDNINAGQFSSGGYIGLRLSFFTAIVGTAVLSRHVRSNWFFGVSSAIAIVFFMLLYRDGKAVQQIASSLEKRTAGLTGMPRVTALVEYPPFSLESALSKPLSWPGLKQARMLLYNDDFGMNIAHIIDAACIGRCISYGNYEPSTYQFRVRPLPGNHFAPTTGSAAADMEQGRYVVQNDDLPMYSIYVCGASPSDFCMRPLKAGETNGYPLPR